MTKLDDLDKAVLSRLREDGRVSYRVISDELGIPHTTVFTRVRKLMSLGVIKRFTIEVDDDKVRELELLRKSKKELVVLLLKQQNEV